MRAHLMLSVQFQEDKQSDTVGIILHTTVINMITQRNYINIQGTPIPPEERKCFISEFFLWHREHILNYLVKIPKWKFPQQSREMHYIEFFVDENDIVHRFLIFSFLMIVK